MKISDCFRSLDTRRSKDMIRKIIYSYWVEAALVLLALIAMTCFFYAIFDRDSGTHDHDHSNHGADYNATVNAVNMQR